MQVEADDNAHILIDFGESVFAVVTTGFTIQKYRTPAIEIYGSKGTIQMMGDDWDPEGYELWQNEVGRVASLRGNRFQSGPGPTAFAIWSSASKRTQPHHHT